MLSLPNGLIYASALFVLQKKARYNLHHAKHALALLLTIRITDG